MDLLSLGMHFAFDLWTERFRVDDYEAVEVGYDR